MDARGAQNSFRTPLFGKALIDFNVLKFDDFTVSFSPFRWLHFLYTSFVLGSCLLNVVFLSIKEIKPL